MGVEGIERDKKTPYNMQYILKLDKNTMLMCSPKKHFLILEEKRLTSLLDRVTH